MTKLRVEKSGKLIRDPFGDRMWCPVTKGPPKYCSTDCAYLQFDFCEYDYKEGAVYVNCGSNYLGSMPRALYDEYETYRKFSGKDQ